MRLRKLGEQCKHKVQYDTYPTITLLMHVLCCCCCCCCFETFKSGIVFKSYILIVIGGVISKQQCSCMYIHMQSEEKIISKF